MHFSVDVDGCTIHKNCLVFNKISFSFHMLPIGAISTKNLPDCYKVFATRPMYDQNQYYGIHLKLNLACC